MTKFIKELLKKHKRRTSWLAINMDIPKRTIEWKIANDKWSFRDFQKIIEIFNLTNDELAEIARKGEQNAN